MRRSSPGGMRLPGSNSLDNQRQLRYIQANQEVYHGIHQLCQFEQHSN